MNTEIKQFEEILEEVDTCNTYFSNHVGSHNQDYIRKGLIILQAIVILGILFI